MLQRTTNTENDIYELTQNLSLKGHITAECESKDPEQECNLEKESKECKNNFLMSSTLVSVKSSKEFINGS